jgi:hypothetical protein
MTISRLLSLIVLTAAYFRAWSIPSGLWLVTLVAGPILCLIWFPKQLNEFTFRSWYRGYEIDSPTPGVLIAVMGWILLILFAGTLFLGRFSGK